MSDWQERITRDTPPAIWAEHELRYRLVAPLIASSTVWADLGCGNGIAAATALGDACPAQVILCDLEPETITRAAYELGRDDARQLAGDLTDPELLASLGDELRASGGDRVITCFEVVEHLSSFVPLLAWSTELARAGVATFAISVPNDAFWSIENPFHAGRWGDGAFEELRGLLPAEQTLLRQVAVTGSALAHWDGAPERYAPDIEVEGSGLVATHFIAAFGPRHAELTGGALCVVTPQHEQRRWERQRESNLAFAEAMAARRGDEMAALQATADRQRSELDTMIAEREEWRTYIHKLERELGCSPSGAEPGPGQP